MSYLPSRALWIIFGVSEGLALMLTIIIANDGDPDAPAIWSLYAFVGLSVVFNFGIALVSLIVQAVKNATERDTMKTQIMKNEYYRMEAKRRLDKESK